jgi:hypothetical protein
MTYPCGAQIISNGCADWEQKYLDGGGTIEAWGATGVVPFDLEEPARAPGQIDQMLERFLIEVGI